MVNIGNVQYVIVAMVGGALASAGWTLPSPGRYCQLPA